MDTGGGRIMEKENVLEIEFQPVFDKWAWIVVKQNEEILIEEKVKAINEKYGIKKRWRAEHGGVYYCINEPFGITWYIDGYTVTSNKKYENGNYFKTEAEALEYAEYMKQKSHEWHEMRGRDE